MPLGRFMGAVGVDNYSPRSLRSVALGSLGGDFTFNPNVFASDPGGFDAGGDGGGGFLDALTSQLPSLVKTGESIIASRYGGPQPGQYFATGPGGQSVAYSLPKGASSGVSINPFGGGASFLSSGLSSLLPLILLGGGALVLVSVLGGRK